MTSTYDQYCPVARAAEILSQRWTMLILRDLHAGCTRFTELKRGVPKISPSLLTTRLRELERNGLICRTETDGAAAYELTQAGQETLPIVQLFGLWGHRWLHDRKEPEKLDEAFLVYAYSASLDTSGFDESRTVIQITFTDTPAIDWPNWWLVATDNDVDMCAIDPGFDVDVYVEGDLQTLYHLNHGVISHRSAQNDGGVSVSGDTSLVRTFSSWFKGSPFSSLPKPPKQAIASEMLDFLSS